MELEKPATVSWWSWSVSTLSQARVPLAAHLKRNASPKVLENLADPRNRKQVIPFQKRYWNVQNVRVSLW